MRVEFTKHVEKGRPACSWVATRKRTVVPGSYMPVGKDLPHDVGQYVVEAAAGIQNGFWGLIDRGATFKSTGRKLTKPGRDLIRDHRADLDESEAVAGGHLHDWRAGATTEVAVALQRAMEQWTALDPNERLVFEWPSATGQIRQVV